MSIRRTDHMPLALLLSALVVAGAFIGVGLWAGHVIADDHQLIRMQHRQLLLAIETNTRACMQ
jgi:hypothetical protein